MYEGHHTTFYRSCGFNDDKESETTICSDTPRNDNAQAHRIEWERVVPGSRFGRTGTCWLEPASFDDCQRGGGGHIGGRECCCRKVDAQSKAMEVHLQSVRPAVRELKAATGGGTARLGGAAGGRRRGHAAAVS